MPSEHELAYLLLKQMDPPTFGRQGRRQVDDLGQETLCPLTYGMMSVLGTLLKAAADHWLPTILFWERFSFSPRTFLELFLGINNMLST